MKEAALLFAAKEGWKDVLQHFEKAHDATNRRYLVDAYEKLKDKEAILRMEEKEEDPE